MSFLFIDISGVQLTARSRLHKVRPLIFRFVNFSSVPAIGKEVFIWTWRKYYSDFGLFLSILFALLLF